jgi:hypothetical protein
MVEKKILFTSLSSCSRPPILMGDYTLVVVAGEGRVALPNGSFENDLHVLNLSINILLVHHITQTCKRVEFTSDAFYVLDMHSNSIVVIGEVDKKIKVV